MIKKLFYVSLFVLVLTVGVKLADAQLGAVTKFGGHAVGVTIPCTCPGPTLSSRWQVFAPLYFTRVPIVGALAVPPFLFYKNFSLPPLAWGLGFYTPGAGISCGIWVSATPPFCIFLPNVGAVNPTRTGSSPPRP